MQTVIIDHYPAVLKGIKEIQNIAKAEDIEFSKLKARMAESLSNMFIVTADKTGVERFERLMDISPKAIQTLEERKAVILFQMNRRKMSLSQLKDMLSDYLEGVEFSADIDKQEMKITIDIDGGQVGLIRNMIDEVLPLDIYFVSGYRAACEALMRYRNSINFRFSFYPRFNLPRLRLDGSWRLDGSRRLSGYDTQETVDLYPVCMSARFGVKASPETATRIHIPLGGAREPVKTGTRVSFKGQASAGPELSECVRISTGASHHMSAGTITIRNESYLDGTWRLDGSRKLNGGAETR